MRDRAWRRYMEERIVTKRLRWYSLNIWTWAGFEDVNKISHQHPKFIDTIGTKMNFRFRTHTTTKWETNYKTKYSPNRGPRHWRDGFKTREKDKKIFLKILKENGLK
jgi:hypothetical protein